MEGLQNQTNGNGRHPEAPVDMGALEAAFEGAPRAETLQGLGGTATGPVVTQARAERAKEEQEQRYAYFSQNYRHMDWTPLPEAL